VIERLHLLDDPELGGPRAPADVAAAEQAAPGASPLMESAIDDFLSRLKVQPVKNSQLVAVSFGSGRPALSADVANALVDVYIQQTLDFRYRVSAEAGTWLDHESEEQSRKVQAAELALQKFTQEEGLANVEERRTLLEQKLKDQGATLNAARARRLDKEALARQMQSARSAEELPEVLASPLVQGLRAELAGLERQAAQLTAKGYLEGHPEVAKIRQQIDGTKQKIAVEASRVVTAAQNDYRVAVAQEESAAAALEAAKSEAQDLSRRGVRYDALKRDLEASKNLADGLLARQKQTDVARDVRASNVHVIDAASAPALPVHPRPVRDLGLTVALALTLATAVAFFRDYLDTSVGRPSDVRRLGLPVLGIIPDTPARSPLLVPGAPRKEPFAEGYRALRTTLDPPADTEGQVLLVTSSLPGEGKSLTCVNLALTLASSDERVLLVDADLRRPALAPLLNGRRAPGLSDLLTGATTPEHAIQRLRGTRLSLIAGGTAVQRNPADLLGSGIMRDLLSDLRQRFDRIVIDSPPSGSIADALILSPLADGVLVVTRAGKVSRAAVMNVLERLVHARANILGVVLNRAPKGVENDEYGPAFAASGFGASWRPALPPAPSTTAPGRWS
jgi:capsular exopolysaccharide synthesis family protein